MVRRLCGAIGHLTPTRAGPHLNSRKYLTRSRPKTFPQQPLMVLTRGSSWDPLLICSASEKRCIVEMKNICLKPYRPALDQAPSLTTCLTLNYYMNPLCVSIFSPATNRNFLLFINCMIANHVPRCTGHKTGHGRWRPWLSLYSSGGEVHRKYPLR